MGKIRKFLEMFNSESDSELDRDISRLIGSLAMTGVIVVAIVFVFNSIKLRAVQAESNAQWEYMFVVRLDPHKALEELNKAGLESWEVVTVMDAGFAGNRYTLKRRKR